jgi:ATP-dependent RNA helicase DDX42
MFDHGFEPQVRSISSHIRPDRQTLLFSATFPPRIESLARDILTDPIRIAIGNTHASNSDIVQRVEVLEDTMKWGWLTARLATFVQEGQVIVFIGRKSGVDELTANLKASGFEAKALHGDLMQHERDTVINDFKKGRFGILVATDVVGRGLDIPSVRNVVNYDVPKDIDSHVHRIGRTGRAGVMGRAWTLVNPKEDFFAGLLVRNLEESGQEVPGVLMALARKNPRFGGGGFRGRGGRGRGGRGRGSDRGRGRGGIGMSEPRGGFHSDSGQSSQWKPEQRHADMLGGRVGSSGSGSAGPSRFQGMSFAKASTSEGSK